MIAPVIDLPRANPLLLFVVIALARRLWRVTTSARPRATDAHAGLTELTGRVARVTRPQATGRPLAGLTPRRGARIVIGRIERAGRARLASGSASLEPGDLVTLVGAAEEVEWAITALGESHDQAITLDHSQIDFRRIFVSNTLLSG